MTRRLRVLLPERVELDQWAGKIVAEGQHGSFALLERHRDWVEVLVPGLLCFTDLDGQESFLAVDGGLLVKVGKAVTVSTPQAVRGELGDLERAVRDRFGQLDRKQRQAQRALEKMRTDFVRRYTELEQRD